MLKFKVVMRKIVITFLSSLILLPVANAKYPTNDPCDEFVGKWKGLWQSTAPLCTWNATAQGRKVHHDVILSVEATNGQPFGNCDLGGSFVLYGHCKDGVMRLGFTDSNATLEGTIIANYMKFKGSNYHGMFNKQF